MPTRISQSTDVIVPAATANTTTTIPAGWAIRDIFVRSSNANAVTGGIRIGTTAGAVDVLVALAVAGNSFGTAVPLLRVFSAGSDQTLFIQAVVAWNSASVDLVFTLDRAIP